MTSSDTEAAANDYSAILRRGLLVAALMFHTLLLAWSSHVHSPGIDEVAHMTAGLAIWHFGNFGIYRVNPPLVKVLATAPVYYCNHRTDWTSYNPNPTRRTEWRVGEAFISINGQHAFWLFTVARWACIPLSLLAACICYAWASELYGGNAGLLAAGLWCASPIVLGWGATITPDIGATAIGALSFYWFWKWLNTPIWRYALFSGVLLGLAQLTKTTWIILFVYWPIVWTLWRLDTKKQNRPSLFSNLSQMVSILLLGLWIINCGYGFDGSLCPLESYEFVSDCLTGRASGIADSDRAVGNRFSGSILARVPVPVPRDYLMGIDIQKGDFESGRRSLFYDHHQIVTPWWFYFCALAVQVPLGIWFLFVGSCWSSAVGDKYRTERRDELFLFVPAIVVFVFVGSQYSSVRHLRYLLPCFPFAMIWMSRCLRHYDVLCLSRLTFVSVSFCWACCSSLWMYPHSLAYCNELVGIVRTGLGGEIEIDYGQDLLFLKQWSDQHPEVTPLYLDCFSSFKPSLSGIVSSPVAPAQVPGYYAISDQRLRSKGFSYEYFRLKKPMCRVGGSIFIYQIESEDK